ncbi:hypothetical protein EDB85DRAFT_975813 [Lactarius pseudohatsudake]|nr:hypothetical protein EDB85DRAFT_975813 [Lactarius pseudohatsudake]
MMVCHKLQCAPLRVFFFFFRGLARGANNKTRTPPSLIQVERKLKFALCFNSDLYTVILRCARGILRKAKATRRLARRGLAEAINHGTAFECAARADREQGPPASSSRTRRASGMLSSTRTLSTSFCYSWLF